MVLVLLKNCFRYDIKVNDTTDFQMGYTFSDDAQNSASNLWQLVLVPYLLLVVSHAFHLSIPIFVLPPIRPIPAKCTDDTWMIRMSTSGVLTEVHREDCECTQLTCDIHMYTSTTLEAIQSVDESFDGNRAVPHLGLRHPQY